MTKLKDLIANDKQLEVTMNQFNQEQVDVLVKKTSEGIIEVSDPNFIEKLHQYRDLQKKEEELKAISKQQDELKEYFKNYAELHDADTIQMFGINVVQIKETERSSFDSKNFKLHYPEMAKEFEKTTKYKTVKIN